MSFWLLWSFSIICPLTLCILACSIEFLIEVSTKTFLSEKIQDEANRIVQDCYNETLDILRNNINDLHIVSNHLFENETMTHEELKSLIRKEMC